jgi:hypothetical protein
MTLRFSASLTIGNLAVQTDAYNAAIVAVNSSPKSV